MKTTQKKPNLLMIWLFMFAAITLQAQSPCTTTCTSNAGADKTYCCVGQEPTIGVGGSGCNGGGPSSYSWAPATGLNCSTCASTTAAPTVTTTYTLYCIYASSCCCSAPPPANCTAMSCPTAIGDPVKVTVSLGSCCERIMNPEKKDEVSSKEITVYPNPSNGIFTLEFSKMREGTCVVFYNAEGKVVLSDQNLDSVKQKFDYDLSGKANGIYFVKIFAGTEILCFKKVIKQ